MINPYLIFDVRRKRIIQVELLSETEEAIKVKYGLHTMFLPKSKITIEKIHDSKEIMVTLPTWLFKDKFYDQSLEHFR